MQKILVKDFSCIKNADLEISPLTLIIGPQASGKSVLSKLVYFFTHIITDFNRYVTEDQLCFDDFEKRISALFFEWFPCSAWGAKRFVIKFELGEFSIYLHRVGKQNKIKIQFCDKFKEIYLSTHTQYLSAIKKAEAQNNYKDEFLHYEMLWQMRQNISLALKKWLDREYIQNQLFIPAGRSFFTSVGKALVAFEHSGIMDPLTLDFGRKFSTMRERQLRRVIGSKEEPSSLSNILFSEILGGHLKMENGKEFISTPDGRLIPFSALSSGQQELLPLAVAIRAMLPSKENDIAFKKGASLRQTIYIEEPEAHLFPRAQNKLVEILATLLPRRNNNNLLITTHSPYVLAKFNNLIKAGSLSRPGKNEINMTISSIIPMASWVLPKQVNAYAIIDGQLKNIIDKYGLIAADYLDDVSGDISKEFSKLLAIEFSK